MCTPSFKRWLFCYTSKIVINATWTMNIKYSAQPVPKYTMKLKTCSKHSLRVREFAVIVGFALALVDDDDDVIERYACVRVKKKKKKRWRKKQTKRWKNKTKCILVLLCASVISSVSRSFVCSFDGNIDFFVRFIRWIFHIRKKTPHFISYRAPSSMSLFFYIYLSYISAQGTLTCYIWTQSNILCALCEHDS